MSNSHSDRLIEILDNITKAENVGTFADDVKCSLLDYLGVALRGAADNKAFGIEYLREAEAGDVLPIGFEAQVSGTDAAFLNGNNAHFLELDDGQRKGMIHLGAVMFSALLPVAVKKGLPFEAFARGVCAGYETAVRVAVSVQPEHKKRGFHTSATCGTLGAAMAIAYALDYTKEQKASTLAAAVTCSGGTLALQDDASQMKTVNIGAAAASGVLAARIGSAALTPPDDPINGDRGFIRLYSDGANSQRLLDYQEGDAPAIKTIYRKRHASCRHTHGPVDSVIRIMESERLTADQIESVDIGIYGLAIKGHTQVEIPNASVARLSMPYAVAAAAIYGSVGIDAFEDVKLADPHINDLMGKVHIHEDTELTALLPKCRASIVKITTSDGREFTDKADNPEGEPESPFGMEEISRKYSGLMNGTAYNAGKISELREIVIDLENRMDDLLKLLKDGLY